MSIGNSKCQKCGTNKAIERFTQAGVSQNYICDSCYAGLKKCDYCKTDFAFWDQARNEYGQFGSRSLCLDCANVLEINTGKQPPTKCEKCNNHPPSQKIVERGGAAKDTTKLILVCNECKQGRKKQDKKWKDCDNCRNNLEKQINKLKDWEVKKKAEIQACFEERHGHSSLSGSSGMLDCGQCPNLDISGAFGGTEEFCEKCKEVYILEINNFGDKEPDKHTETCPKRSENNNQREREVQQLRTRIAELETIANRTAEQEQELRDKKKELTDLEKKKQEERNLKKPETNYLPWIIGGGVILTVIIVVIFLSKSRKVRKG